MKWIFCSTLIALTITSFFGMNATHFDAVQANTEQATDQDESSFAEEREEVEQILLKLNRHLRNQDREHPPKFHRSHEHSIEQQKHRIQKMHIAAEHLEQAGLHDLAHRVHREAEEYEARIREHIHKMVPDQHVQHEIHEALKQMGNEIRELKSEVRELREIIISKRSPKTRKEK